MNAEALDLMLQRELPNARDGCPHAYGRIVGACQNTVTAIALAITRDVAASEDIAQEAFLRAWQQLARLHSPASFMPWLRQITRNLARDWLRAQRRRPMSGEAAEIAIGMAADPAPSPGERLQQIEEEQAAAEIISALPEDSRETLLLYYREGQRSQQVADLLGISDAAVRKRLSRARSSVREELMQRFGRFACGSAPGLAFGQTLTLAIAAGKPALGGGLEAVTGGVGAGIATKSVLGAAGAGGAAAVTGLLGGLLAGGAAFWFSLRMLLRYADDEGERQRIVAAYRRYVLRSLAAIAVALAVAVGSSGFWPLTLACLAGLLLVNYDMLVSLPAVMTPLLRRDAQRRPEGAVRRQMSYRLSFGASGIFVTNACVLMMLVPLLLQRTL